MKAFFKRAADFLGMTWLWSLLLVLSTTLAVWFFGPLLAVDDYRFWQGSVARLLTISTLFLLWGLAMVFVNRRGPTLQRDYELRPHQHLIIREQRTLRARFKVALHALRVSTRYGERSGRWRNDLPWFLLIGNTGSGKTCLLEAGGLQLALDRIDPSSTRSGSGTRDCEWYFADDGVLVDTAGRYLSLADGAVDAAGWSTLLGLLKGRRRFRPLDGVLVALSVDTLLNGSEQELEILARQVHSRLQGIQQSLHVQIPVYLILTQADRLPGFVEFFDRLEAEGHDAVLGERLVVGRGSADIAEVRRAFEALLQRLSSELIQRLHQERNTERRGRMLDFPHQVAQLGERLCLFVELAFSAHSYQSVNALRGFYLTSAGGNTLSDGGALLSGGQGQGSGAGDTRPRFIQGLLSRVVFSGADLAGLDSLEQHRLRPRQRMLALAALLVVGAAGLLWMRSYSVNHQHLEQVRELARHFLPPSSVENALAILPSLDTHLAATRVFPPRGQASVSEQVGLYQGDSSRPVLDQAYEQALQRLLLSHVNVMLERQVRASLEDRELLSDSLRAYLMLNLRERRDPDWLKERVAGQWSLLHAGDTRVQRRLNEHFERLLEQPFAYPINNELVAQARQVLRGESLASVVYRVLREQARNLEPYRFSQHLDPRGRVFAGIDQPIPGFYTQRYVHYFAAQGSRLVNTIVQDNWVLGEGADLSPMDLRRLMVELEQRYFSEYAETWSEALGQVRLQDTDTARQGAEQLASLTSAHSPLLQLLQQVRENTRFSSAPEQVGGLAGSMPGPLTPLPQAALGNALGVIAGESSDTARRALQRRFESLHQLLDDQQNPGTELTQALQALNQLHLQLAALSRVGQPEQAAFDMVKQRMHGQQDALSDLRNVAMRLPLPLASWVDGLADSHWRRVLDDAYRHLNQRYQSEVYGFYAKAIKQRYPFNAHASSDVALTDFHEFFKPQGVMARFFDSYLRPFVSGDAGRYRLRSLDGRTLPMSRALLDQLGKAKVIRRGFFADDQGLAQVRFTLAPYSLDSTVSRAIFRFGSQQMEYRHGPIVPMAFQWPTEAEDGRSSLVLERDAERAQGIEKNTGPWSLFRLFDLMQSESLSGRDVLVLKADLGGSRVNYLLTSQSTPSPFDLGTWRTFRIPEQL
ncbi:type VI secretion system membrane subunit TssM [Pseudomonas sp. CCM 7891]|uniref:Type VI secretion system membrane subunit TssM n=1 Tax=Pseudomonas karstica TaxID=1055468 RepID=A0A7X2UXG7_9PSED|nr:type VI secretion system membrane subunit TssM [Pseudomonas karstica]MTD18989.1 type VI secretion system membrane subunit TssM [Pseudomonas karstica]